MVGFPIEPANAMVSGGEPPWFEAAITRMLLPITTDIQKIKTDIQKITADVGNIKTDVQGIKDDVRTLKEGQAQVQHMAAIVSLSNLHSNTPHDPTNMF